MHRMHMTTYRYTMAWISRANGRRGFDTIHETRYGNGGSKGSSGPALVPAASSAFRPVHHVVCATLQLAHTRGRQTSQSRTLKSTQDEIATYCGALVPS